MGAENLEFFGKSRDEIIGKCDEEIFPSNIVETFKETDKIVIESKVGKLYEDKINIFGKKVTYETYKLPIYDENNNLKYIVGSCKDTSLQNIAKDEIFTHYSKAISINADESQDSLYKLLNRISNSIIEHSNAKGLAINLYDKDNLEFRLNRNGRYKRVNPFINNHEFLPTKVIATYTGENPHLYESFYKQFNRSSKMLYCDKNLWTVSFLILVLYSYKYTDIAHFLKEEFNIIDGTAISITIKLKADYYSVEKDVENLAKGWIANSLMNDDVHLNAVGREVVAKIIYEWIQNHGWVD